MTNVSKTPEKVALRRQMVSLGEKALENAGWHVERIQGIGKSSVRRIVKGEERHAVAIRTTQDAMIAFPRNENDNGWLTLDDVDYVVAVTVDDKNAPKNALAFMVDGDEMRERFNRSYRARLEAGHKIPKGRGVWISMFLPEEPGVASTVGGGIALGKEPMISKALDALDIESLPETSISASNNTGDDAPLTIAEAKMRLAATLGVDPEKVKIVIEA